jgi:hypothetical protein
MSTLSGQVVSRDDVEEIGIEFDPIQESRRTAPRITTTLLRTVKLSSGIIRNARSVDVSSSGIGLLSLKESRRASPSCIAKPTTRATLVVARLVAGLRYAAPLPCPGSNSQ